MKKKMIFGAAMLLFGLTVVANPPAPTGDPVAGTSGYTGSCLRPLSIEYEDLIKAKQESNNSIDTVPPHTNNISTGIYDNSPIDDAVMDKLFQGAAAITKEYSHLEEEGPLATATLLLLGLAGSFAGVKIYQNNKQKKEDEI